MSLRDVPSSRREALAADAADPLASFRDLFVLDEAGPVYMDGNSLGRQPKATALALSRLLEEWGSELVGGWQHWADLPQRVGDRVGRLVGAAPGQVVVADSTTVNLYKLAAAALDGRPGRDEVVADARDFPTVRYVVQGLASQRGLRVRWLDGPWAEGPSVAGVSGVLSPRTALVCLSGVNFRSGAVADMAGVNRAAHEAGALVVWDLSHAGGAVPVDLDGTGSDLAVGCGYKYLNGGPGAPAWLYVRATLQGELLPHVWGWWGQEGQFEMGPEYRPVAGIGRFLSGTPSLMGLVALDAGIEPLLEAGMEALWHKARRLTLLMAERAEQVLVPLGARLASPARDEERGGHISVAHELAWPATRLLVERGLVVPDFRPPDVLRLAPVPLYTRYVEAWDAVGHLAAVLADEQVRVPVPRSRVT